MFALRETTRGFRKDRLPSAEKYYDRELGRTRGSGPWRSARCPFHDDRRPSLSVNVVHLDLGIEQAAHLAVFYAGKPHSVLRDFPPIMVG